jgi:hypothetical protein
MAKSRIIGSGGGSSKLVQSRAPKAEPKAHAMSPGGVSQMGSALGNVKGNPTGAVTPLQAGKGYQPVGPTDNVKAVGVGGGRTVRPSGGQGRH